MSTPTITTEADVTLMQAFGESTKTAVLDVLADAEWHTREEIVVKSGFARDSLQLALAGLERNSIIRSERNAKGTCWKLNVRHPVGLFVAERVQGEFL